MSTLIVCLPPVSAGPSTNYSYLRLNAGSIEDSQASASAALLPAIERGSGEVVVVIPSAALSWHSIQLPDGVTASSPRLRSILEGLLEERLLDDLATVHLALAPTFRTAENSLTWVAACNKAWLFEHLQVLEAAQRPVTKVVPEFSPDLETLQVHAISDENSSYWVAIGASVDGLMHLPFSSAALKAIPRSEDSADWQVFAEPAMATEAELFAQAPVTLLTRSQRWAEAVRSPWDMAQFELSKTARSRSLKKVKALVQEFTREPQWRLARWGLGLFFVANLAGLNVFAWQQQASLAASRSEIKNTLMQTFPNVKVVIDAPLQMQRELTVLRQAAGVASGGDLEVMLNALGAATGPGYSINNINYSPGQLRVSSSADVKLDAAKVSALLKAKGYTALLEGDFLVVTPDAASVQ
jgi:general secretion pathway protein L